MRGKVDIRALPRHLLDKVNRGQMPNEGIPEAHSPDFEPSSMVCRAVEHGSWLPFCPKDLNHLLDP
jgi:hypothetical protein